MENHCDPRLPNVWDLPDDLRPEPLIPQVEDEVEEEQWNGDEAISLEERGQVHLEARGLSPTANLLGWAPSVRLTNEQRRMIENCGIGEDVFSDSFERYLLNQGLFEALADRIRASADKYKSGASLHEHVNGSLTQCPLVEREPNEREGFSRTKLYSEGSIRASSAFQLDERTSVATRVMSYRMRKEPIGERHSWACYDFRIYEARASNNP
jgi:hypothetical protein